MQQLATIGRQTVFPKANGNPMRVSQFARTTRISASLTKKAIQGPKYPQNGISAKFSAIRKISVKSEVDHRYLCLFNAVNRNGNGLDTKNGRNATPSNCIARSADWYLSPRSNVIIFPEKMTKRTATGKPAKTKNFTLRS